MKLVVGDKNYSSWSMRPWVLMRHFGIPFDEVSIELRRDDTAARIRAYSPSGKMPCLVGDDGVPVWDSLAIAETLAERFAQHALWPRDPAARARARCVSAEMHAGFAALRGEMPLDIRGTRPARELSPAALDDVARVDAIWRECVAASGGPFLFGAFSIADAMYAPVVLRVRAFAVPLSPQARDYAASVVELPAVREWIDAARRETTVIDVYGPSR
ncbi:glutathione S-transferase family protein [Burkholderia singularis]|uniref:Glutathione S-transferase n=1 Tax=Burkholderia singularis TaxID=1503053 RepID=A0A238H9S1_9BURK|nr:glutathione S-transferase family protein [Burkholderia singularis]SMG01912.1 Glutathione S-transferase [Burkholderia singularis]